MKRESKLGSQLSSVILEYLIVILLLMLIIIPLLNYSTSDTGPEYGLSFIHEISMNTSINNVSKKALVDIFVSAMSQGPIRLPSSIIVSLLVDPLYQGYVVRDDYRLEQLRDGSNFEISFSSVDTTTNTSYTTTGVLDDRQILYVLSWYGIYLTICVGLLLLLGFIIFTSDVKRLVLTPIERMMNLVEFVAKNPLQSIQELRMLPHGQGEKSSGQYETEILESSLEKVTGLLRVGFGEAGAGIIRANLDTETSSGAVINPLLPGIRVYAIFGFCDIHHFEESKQIHFERLS